MKHLAQNGQLMLETDDVTGRVIRYASFSQTIREPQTELCEMCLRYGSDKCGNGYTAFYHEYFGQMRSSVSKLLEIGISGGYSIKTWREYFPNAFIVGMDNGLHPVKVVELERGDSSHTPIKNFKVFVGDQSKSEDLQQLVKFFGSGYDIIIDDGSHHPTHQQLTFAELWKTVKPGGFYIIEDINMYPAHEEAIAKVFSEFQKTQKLRNSFLDEASLSTIAKEIDTVRFCCGNSEEIGKTHDECDPVTWGGALMVLIKKKV